MPPELGTHIATCLPRLRRYARALVKDRDAADDLVQDTCERAWAKAESWRPGSDARPWLFSIMHNVFIDQRRRPGLELQPLEDQVAEVPVRATQSDQLEVRDVARAFERLPAEFSEVLLLVTTEEMSYEEVSAALSIPVGTVMSRLSRARARLRAILQESSSSHLKVVK